MSADFAFSETSEPRTRQVRSRQAGGHDLLEGARQVGVGASEEGPQAHAELEMKIKVGDNSLSDALLTIIHWPGWTLAEVRLVKAMVDTLQAHVFGVETVGQTLFKGDSSSRHSCSASQSPGIPGCLRQPEASRDLRRGALQSSKQSTTAARTRQVESHKPTFLGIPGRFSPH